ncbi:MAG: TVP38/TMEM64 family protein [Phycisphaerales bacterium]|jgi:uncharacterized membrane protein YdjX (TVP38/TMEM64 family)
MAVRASKPVVLGAALAILAVAVVVGPVLPWIIDLFEGIASLGSWGPAALIGFYVISCVLLIPASIPTLAAGILFGVVKGSLVAMAGGTAGACVAYWVGRLLARDWVARRVAKNRQFTALDNAVDEHGIKVVILSRLSPIAPYAILNYVFGLTKVSFWKYVLGTVIGVLPAMVMYVYVGAGLRSFAEVAAFARGEQQTPSSFHVFFWVGLVVTVVVTVQLTRLARRVLRREHRRQLREERTRQTISDER